MRPEPLHLNRRNGLLLCLAAALLVACGGDSGPPAADGRVQVVTTVGMLADLVRDVGGERVVVRSLVGPGEDPHLFKATRDQARELLGADLLLAVGLGLEGRLRPALERASAAGRPVVFVGEKLDPALLLEASEVGKVFDPHLWMDPVLWARAIDQVEAALLAADPDGADTFEGQAREVRARYAALAEYAERSLASVPEERRILVTAHDAFGYLGRRHGFEVLGIQGLSTESEAGVADVSRLVDLVVRREVPAVFFESTVSVRNVQALIEGARARGHEVINGGELYSDALGPEGTPAATYLGMIDHNVTTITRALGGEAREGGHTGRLER